MTIRHALVFSTSNLVLLAALAAPALAQPSPTMAGGVCVTVDANRDTLAEGERNAARSLVLQAFEAEKLPIDPSGTACAETYMISNVKLGNTITISLAGPRGQRTGRATSLDDLANVYSQMVKSLVTGAPMETGGGATDRNNVTRDQSAPRRVAADNLKYVTLGYGAVVAGHVATGPAFGAGYRYELDRLAIDLSFGLVVANKGSGWGVTGYYPRLAGIWYQHPIADSSPYYGVGLSFGGTAVDDKDEVALGGSGLQGHLTAGYEAFRSSTIRFFGQADLSLPFYTSSNYDDTRSRYTPSITMSIGLGWGTSKTVRVVND